MWPKKRIILFIFIVHALVNPAIYGQVTFVIESLPNATPEEDSIFICGTFNNWNVRCTKYRLQPRLNGTYSITLPAGSGTIEYKFTRGSWMKVETNERNEYRSNRIFRYGSSEKVSVKILNWQDLGGLKRFNFMALCLFAAAFFGVLLLLLVSRIQKPNRLKRRYFFYLNSIIVLLLIGGVAHNQTNAIWQSHISAAGYLLLFVWGPLITVYLGYLQYQKIFKRPVLHYLPVFIIAIVAFLRLFNFKPLAFLSREINPYLNCGNSFMLWLGISVTFFYHIKLFGLVHFKKNNEEQIPQEVRLVKMLYFISCTALLFLGINYLLLLAEISWRILLNFECVLIIIFLIMAAEFYYFWKFPEILRDKVNKYSIINAKEIISRLDELMQQDKPFKNPELNIAELSDMLCTKPHILSKIIHEHFNKNYRDFINEYRVKEFISTYNSDAYKNYTFLALAHEVGFNSKSTFNLAFKKITGLSPREYVNQPH
jgi:AraC-like DNA-binding protein